VGFRCPSVSLFVSHGVCVVSVPNRGRGDLLVVGDDSEVVRGVGAREDDARVARQRVLPLGHRGRGGGGGWKETQRGNPCESPWRGNSKENTKARHLRHLRHLYPSPVTTMETEVSIAFAWTFGGVEETLMGGPLNFTANPAVRVRPATGVFRSPHLRREKEGVRDAGDTPPPQSHRLAGPGRRSARPRS